MTLRDRPAEVPGNPNATYANVRVTDLPAGVSVLGERAAPAGTRNPRPASLREGRAGHQTPARVAVQSPAAEVGTMSAEKDAIDDEHSATGRRIRTKPGRLA
jgi:hypothetical protein